jgi:hypothetical protein
MFWVQSQLEPLVALSKFWNLEAPLVVLTFILYLALMVSVPSKKVHEH